MKDAPLILIAPSTQRQGAEMYDYSMSLSDAYCRSVSDQGGIPWIMSCTPSKEVMAECVRRCDGVYLSGGDDIHPSLYRKDLSPELEKTLGLADPQRDLAELMLIDETFRQRKPLLAICRGQQLLNVAFGGGLIVDIGLERPGCINHSRMDMKGEIVHQIALNPGSLMAGIFGKLEIGVNSSHHQAVLEPAGPFEATARCADGIIEAMELKASERKLLPYFLAVQFHPERLTQPHPAFAGLFRSFVAACAAERKGSA